MKTQCLDQFWTAFGEEGETFEDYVKDIEDLYDIAKTDGSIPPNPLTIDIPATPDTCDEFVGPVEQQIAAKVDELKDVQDCEKFAIDLVCNELSAEVDKLHQDNN